MAESTKKESIGAKIAGFFAGVRAEYAKIIFPDMETLRKQGIAVIVVSVFLGALIFVLDFIMKYLLGFVL